MRILQTVNDPVFKKPSSYSSFENFCINLIRDERDLPFIKLTLKISAVLIPLAVLVYLPIPTWLWWIASIAYLYANNFMFKGPFGLMLHCTSHRPWFKAKHNKLNKFLPWIIGPLFGQTPETYFSHHLGMHHVENNTEDDLSSTMYYQRDSFKGFLTYLSEFFFIGLITLVGYFHKRNLTKLRNKVLYGEFAFIILCAVLSYVNWQATLVVFIIPFLLSRVLMMVGNWAQHTFVDPSAPDNHYKNSITCINTKYNDKCWNDGYHISHHVRPAMHYTEHPAHLQNNLSEYIENKALVFEGIHFLHIWWYVMFKDYNKLADHLVNFDGKTFASREEAIAVMKSRTKKIPKSGKYSRSANAKATAELAFSN